MNEFRRDVVGEGLGGRVGDFRLLLPMVMVMMTMTMKSIQTPAPGASPTPLFLLGAWMASTITYIKEATTPSVLIYGIIAVLGKRFLSHTRRFSLPTTDTVANLCFYFPVNVGVRVVWSMGFTRL